MLFSKHIASILGASAIAIAGLASAGAQELKIAHFMSPMHPMHRFLMEPLAAAVAETSGGSLTMKIYPAGELGAGPVQQYARAVQGVADITFGLQGYTSPQFPRTLLIELPGVANDPIEATNMIWDAYETQLDSEYVGTRPLALWTNDANILISRDKPIRTLEDLQGLKIRVAGAVMAQSVEALGATPVALPAPKIYNALSTGIVDAVLIGPCGIRGFKLDEVSEYYTVGPAMGLAAFYLVMNQGSWDGLSDEGRANISSNTGRELSLSGAQAYANCGAQQVQRMRDAPGETVIDMAPEEVAKFTEILNGVRGTVVSRLEADGVPASDVLAAMQGGN